MNETADENVSPWFDADVKPVHIGAYEREECMEFTGMCKYDWWDGKIWLAIYNGYSGCGSIGVVTTASNVPSRWRGLTKQPVS